MIGGRGSKLGHLKASSFILFVKFYPKIGIFFPKNYLFSAINRKKWRSAQTFLIFSKGGIIFQKIYTPEFLNNEQKNIF